MDGPDTDEREKKSRVGEKGTRGRKRNKRKKRKALTGNRERRPRQTQEFPQLPRPHADLLAVHHLDSPFWSLLHVDGSSLHSIVAILSGQSASE